MSILRLRTLGTLDLTAPDGSELRSVLAQPRRVALLVYLALATPRGPHRRDQLLALFWPDQDETHARNALSQAVYFLRSALGADAVVSRTAEEVALDPGTVWCDAPAFDEAVDSRRYMDAAELYRGELLAGFHVAGAAPEFAAWLDGIRAKYAQRYEIVLRSIAAEREASGDHADAVVWWRRLAAQDPLNSDTALHLMRALAAAGDPGAAIRHARLHETLLREDLDASVDTRITQFVKTLQTPSAVPAKPREHKQVASAPESAPESLISPSAANDHPAGVSIGTGGNGPPQTPTRRGIPWGYIAGAALGVVVGALGIFAFAHARTPRETSSCVAVIPLANYSKDSSENDLAAAVTDGLITELARYQRLSVISATSVAQYKGTRKPVPQIARELNCSHVVEGSVGRDGNHALVNAQLVASSDRHLWAERYERVATDLPALERDIAQTIALQLRATHFSDDSALDSSSARASARRVDPIVYGLYLRGRDFALSRDPAGLRLAIGLYREAIDRDSTFALGYAGLADAYRLAGGLGFMPGEFVRDSAPALARTALALDGSLSETHTSVAATLTDAADWPAAEREYRRALQISPSNALAHQWYAALLITLDRKQEALREVRRAHELDPLSQSASGMNNLIEKYVGIRSPTGRPLPRSVVVDPNHPGTAEARSVNLARAGRCGEANVENKRAQALAPEDNTMLISRVGVRLLCGDRAGAVSLFAEVRRRPHIEQQGLYVAEIFVKLGQIDSAFTWLNRTQHWGMAKRMHLRIDAELQSLRADPRYRELLRKQNMP